MIAKQLSEVKAEVLFNSYKKEIDTLKTLLGKAPLWQPSHQLQLLCEKSNKIIDDIQNRLNQKIVITIIGPCGSGKSTLFNTLIEKDNASLSGIQRPTTQNIVVACRSSEDISFLLNEIRAEEIRVHSDLSIQILDQAILIDTPDTDSTHLSNHIPLLKKIIGVSDILICLFDSENPKRRDHIDFMASYVQQFAGSSLVVALNKCDRQNETDLKEHIIPDFISHIEQSWQQNIANPLCISARSHQRNPEWDKGIQPKHHFDQFDKLKEMIKNTFSESGFNMVRRIENMKSVRDFVYKEISRIAPLGESELLAISGKIDTAETKALDTAMDTFRNAPPSQVIGYNVQLYQRLAEQWVGPLGWMIAIWNRFLFLGSGLLWLFRFGNPVRQILGMISSYRRFKTVKNAVDEIREGDTIKRAIQDYRFALDSQWIDIAEKLVEFGFDESIRESSCIGYDYEALNQEISRIWSETMDEKLNETALKLSKITYQIIFNIPPVAIISYIGWITTTTFLSGKILNGDFFIHAGITAIIISVLCFFAFQSVIKLTADQKKLGKEIFEVIQKRCFRHPSVEDQPIIKQIRIVLHIFKTLRIQGI